MSQANATTTREWMVVFVHCRKTRDFTCSTICLGSEETLPYLKFGGSVALEQANHGSSYFWFDLDILVELCLHRVEFLKASGISQYIWYLNTTTTTPSPPPPPPPF